MSLAALLVLASACTGSGESTTPPAPDSPTTTATTSTTTTTATTTSTTLSQLEQDRRDVYDIHTKFFTEFFDRDERIEGEIDRIGTVLEETATGNQLQRGRAALEETRTDNEFTVSPGYDSNVVEVSIAGDSAVVVDCSQDQSEVLDADGNTLVPRDDFHKFRESHLTRTPEGWRVEETFSGGDERCDPTELDVLSY